MNYKVYQGTELKQTVTSKTAVMNGLQPNRTYEFGVQPNDGNRDGTKAATSVTTRGIRFNIPKTLTVGSTITLRYEEYPLGIVPIGNEPSSMFGGGNKQNLSAKVISTANGSSVVEVAGNVIDVGGANLFQGSQLFTGQAEVKSSQYVKSTIEDYDSTTKMLHLVSNGTANSSSGCYWRSPIIDSGTTWTFSADMKGSGRLSVMKRENSIGPYVLNSMLTDSWTRYWNTGTLTTNSGGAWCIYFDDTTVKLDAYIKLIKVETGDTATPYAAFVDGDTFTAQPDGTCALFSEYKALYY